ncbi:MAG TPA: sigma-54 dependent transcriptional regulator, partial [bacterium]|nr:sigma-54 dependent transcriptional regulator [bacterium]
KGIEIARAENVDIVFLDVGMPDGDGLAALPEIREMPSHPEVIIITGEGSPEGAEAAVKSGAWNYLEKPISTKEMTLHLTRVLQYRQEKVSSGPARALDRGEIIGESPLLSACMDLVAHAANTDVNVLLTGETGTGKDLFARAIHNNSARAGKDFIVVDCAALPETLVESVLFGHVKGAFTSAEQARSGLIEQADGGTLFLDEIGELPLPVQKSFLRVIQERRFRPVGGKDEIASDFRLISATNRNLEEIVKTGVFRSDLLYRIRSVSIELPPLRDRKEDIKYLAMHHLEKLTQKHRLNRKGYSSDFFETLEIYPWPGNIRELIHALETALLAAREEKTIFARHLPINLRAEIARESSEKRIRSGVATPPSSSPAISMANFRDFRREAVDQAEKRYLDDLISVAKGDAKTACEIAGLSRSRFYDLLKKHKISISE